MPLLLCFVKTTADMACMYRGRGAQNAHGKFGKQLTSPKRTLSEKNWEIVHDTLDVLYHDVCNELPFSTVGWVIAWEECGLESIAVRIPKNLTFFPSFFPFLFLF